MVIIMKCLVNYCVIKLCKMYLCGPTGNTVNSI